MRIGLHRPFQKILQINEQTPVDLGVCFKLICMERRSELTDIQYNYKISNVKWALFLTLAREEIQIPYLNPDKLRIEIFLCSIYTPFL